MMTNSPLQKATQLERPSREEMLVRAPSVQYFWDHNRELFEQAWAEWEEQNRDELNELGQTIFDQSLYNAVNTAWQDPSKEDEVRALWTEVSSGVFQAQFFDPEGLVTLRQFLNKAVLSNIPTRPPYGIVLNRFGAMLDKRSEGYLAAPRFQAFYQRLMDHFMRPVARMLFPEVYGFDGQTFGFSIQYQAGVDTSLRLHTDASAATLNINMNLPGEDFSGSEVDFYDTSTGRTNRVSFAPGVAMIHRGNVPHAAQPITSGERSNLVLWLFGDRGRIPHTFDSKAFKTAEERWTIPQTVADHYAPF